MAEHDKHPEEGTIDQRLSVQLLSGMFGAGLKPANTPNIQGMPSKLIRKLSSDKRREYNMQQQQQSRPHELTVLGMSYNTRQPRDPNKPLSPVYDVACVESSMTDGEPTAEMTKFDFSQGYLQPMDINPKIGGNVAKKSPMSLGGAKSPPVKYPKSTPSTKSYLTVYGGVQMDTNGAGGGPTTLHSPIYDMTGVGGVVRPPTEGIYDPVGEGQQQQEIVAKTKKKKRGFPWKRDKGAINSNTAATDGGGSGGTGSSGGFFSLRNLLKFKNRKEERHSSHVYAEPDIPSETITRSPHDRPSSALTTDEDSPADKYSQFVRDSGAIYANNDKGQGGAQEMSLGQAEYEKPQPKSSSTASGACCLRGLCGKSRLCSSSCLEEVSRRRVVCVVVTVILILLLVIGLLVYFLGARKSFYCNYGKCMIVLSSLVNL